MGTLEKAKLTEMTPAGESWTPSGDPVEVQFNPLTLKVTYTNQLSNGDQPGGSPKQFVGQSTTKMSLELWFDSTDDQSDVRLKTGKIAYFITPKADTQEGNKKIAPRVQFSWGTFLFSGFIDSMDENIEFWSEKGVPLRASMTLSLSEQAFQFGREGDALGDALANLRAVLPRAGQTLQEIAMRYRAGKRWQDIGAANGVENPRMLDPGQPIVTS